MRMRGVLLAAGFGITTAFTVQSGKFTVTSTDITAGTRIKAAHVFNGFGCTGGNVSPSLKWSGAPTGTKSFAITTYDPDAPTGSGWWHWVVYNIPRDVMKVEQGAGDASRQLLPAGTVQGNTDFGSPGYGGPCPPKGRKPHRYTFTIFALDVEKLELPANATAAFIGFNLNAHTLGKARLTALYAR